MTIMVCPYHPNDRFVDPAVEICLLCQEKLVPVQDEPAPAPVGS